MIVEPDDGPETCARQRDTLQAELEATADWLESETPQVSIAAKLRGRAALIRQVILTAKGETP